MEKVCTGDMACWHWGSGGGSGGGGGAVSHHHSCGGCLLEDDVVNMRRNFTFDDYRCSCLKRRRDAERFTMQPQRGRRCNLVVRARSFLFPAPS